MPNSHSLKLSFTAASLRPELMRIMGDLYLASGDWAVVKRHVLDTNALQCRSSASAIRMERELRQRLQALTREQINLLVTGHSGERALLAWLAVVKQTSFLFDFAAETLRSKLEMHDPILRTADCDRYFEEKVTAHREVASLSDSSRVKVRRVMLLMLREADILQDGEAHGHIHRPILLPGLDQAIRKDSPRWLAAFLVPNNEIIQGA